MSCGTQVATVAVAAATGGAPEVAVATEVVVLFNRDWSDSTRLLASLSMSPLPDMPTHAFCVSLTHLESFLLSHA